MLLVQRAVPGQSQAAVCYAGGGAETIELLRRCGPTTPGLLLLDLKMPKVDGFDVLKFIACHPTLRPQRIAVLTSSDSEKDVAEALRLGADFYLMKPFSFAEIRSMMGSLLAACETGEWPDQLPCELARVSPRV